MFSGQLRAGDWAEVRPREEILATLDSAGKIDGLPFMPEMLAYCGRRFRVAAVAHKTCDPAHKTGGRRMRDAVHLEGLRCDGSAHGGCQASCLLFWKTAWLKTVGDTGSTTAARQPRSGLSDADGLARLTIASESAEGPVYSCQATCMHAATTLLPWWDVRQYFRDVASRNVTFGHATRFLLLSWIRACMRRGIGFRLFRRLYNAAHQRITGREAPESALARSPHSVPAVAKEPGLQPGESVVVRPYPDIHATLNASGKNRGLWFDMEMTVFCDQSFRVERRVERIIDEVSGRMLAMKTPCITLQGVYCKGVYSRLRLFCPRAITPYWREAWLDRAPGDRTGA
jgi:hypothetical protein